jgi:hypothetical protein
MTWPDQMGQHMLFVGDFIHTPTWLTTTPRRPTIIRLQVTSQRTTKLQHSLNTSRNSRSSSLRCCSARVERALDVNTFADSAAEKRASNSESFIAVSSDGDAGGLWEQESATGRNISPDNEPDTLND